MSDNRISLGAKGEKLAVDFLREIGMTIICTNYRCRYGEIDIIAKDRETTVFIEVKSRSGLAFGTPSAAVTRRKQGQITKVAQHYLVDKSSTDIPLRFDVVAILVSSLRKPEIEYIPNAFEVCE